MNIQSVIWLHDGIWILPPPEITVLQEVTKHLLPNTASPEELFKATPISHYLDNDPRLLKLHQELQKQPHSNLPQQKKKTWSEELVQDATARTTRAKQIRDLAWHNKQAIIASKERPPTHTIEDFFRKKGLQ